MKPATILTILILTLLTIAIIITYNQQSEQNFCQQQLKNIGYDIGEVDAYAIQQGNMDYCTFLNSKKMKEDYKKWLTQP